MTRVRERNLYNEIDKYAAQWLRNLIAKGLIPDGEVDTRSIVDVLSDDLRGFTQCHFFAGLGGWSRALDLAGWPRDRPVWTGSCPCGPFSLAGEMDRFADDRHLWPDWVRHIRERSPAVVFGEQVASATEWLRLVRGDLENLGYAVGASSIEAASAGADHLRDRFWFVADREGQSGGPRYGEGGAIKHGGVAADGRSHVDMAHADSGIEQRAGSRIRGGGQSSSARDNLDGRGPLVDGLFEGLERYARDVSREIRWPQSVGSIAAPGDELGAGWSLSDADSRNRDGRPSLEIGRPEGRGSSDGPGEEYEWVVGIDGKHRRVKSGLRLLAHGVSARVDKLRALGNAIDPRPASQFIAAYMESRAW